MKLPAFAADDTPGIRLQRSARLERARRRLDTPGGLDSGSCMAARARGLAVLGSPHHGAATAAP